MLHHVAIVVMYNTIMRDMLSLLRVKTSEQKGSNKNFSRRIFFFRITPLINSQQNTSFAKLIEFLSNKENL